MSKKIGRFEILGELTQSPAVCVYKADDPETSQTIALKTIPLDTLGEQAATLMQGFLDEAESTKLLNSHNIALLYGAGDIDGRFCGAMEYVQGNSIGTMLARSEEFSVWDLQDIARQACQGLDHAHSRKVYHHSFEPGKLMVQWDGTVKILGFGISSMSLPAAYASENTSSLFHYMSPEQVRGEAIDARSNLFSLGVIMYEMMTGRKAFDGHDAGEIKRHVLEVAVNPPHQVNRKIHSALSDIIVKALAKNPAERYQTGQDLVTDLEKYRQSSTVAKPAAVATPAAEPAKAAAAAAGWDGGSVVATSPEGRTPKLDPSEQFISSVVKASVEAIAEEPAKAPARGHAGVTTPSAPPAASNGKSEASKRRKFSDVTELPPLKTAPVEPPPPPPPPPSDPLQELRDTRFHAAARAERANVQPTEVAKRAVEEIKKTPPKWFAYSIGAAVFIILLIVAGIASHVRSEDAESDNPRPKAGAAQVPSATPSPAAVTGTNSVQIPAPAPSASHPAGRGEQSTFISVKPKQVRKPVKEAAPIAVVVPGQLSVNSTPEGAHVSVDGHSDLSWVTPYNMTGLMPGHHTVTISKQGYSSETRNLEIASRSKSFLMVQLAEVASVVLVTADPPGATIFIDGRDSGRVTPSQIALEKPGNHTILVRKQGYLEETTTVNLQAGQSFRYSPTLRQLGTTDEIKTAGKLKKIFGGGAPEGMGTVSVKTQPKGAQIAVNRRILDKSSPSDFYLNPGTYVVDITLTGYKPIQRVVNVPKDGKLSIEETLETQ